MAASRRLSGEQGFSLVELLAAVAILGIAFAVFVGGMGTSIVVSDHHRKQATGETVLRRFAESVKAETYVPNATTTSYGAGFSPPSGYSKAITEVKCLDNNNLFNPCSVGNENGVQRISLTVASTDGRDSETVEILKRTT